MKEKTMQAIKAVDWVLDREAQRSALRQQELRLLSQLDSIRLEQKSLTKELSEMMSKHLGLKQRKFMAMPA